jgi:hypothetical protein
MRTKTLLLTAALSAAGIATSMAQVYSVNAVGYVNTTLVPGFSLVSNPLNNTTGNTVNNLFKNGIQGTIPDGTTVYTFEGGSFKVAQYDSLDNAFTGEAAASDVSPGKGVFVRNPTATALTVTFVGEVPQGPLTHAIPPGFSIQASEVPQAGTANSLGLVGQPGDTIYMWSKTAQNFDFVSSFDELDQAWNPALRPLEVGEAFFYLSRAATARAWTRTFDVNNPTP